MQSVYFDMFDIEWITLQSFCCFGPSFQTGHEVQIVVHNYNDSERPAFTSKEVFRKVRHLLFVGKICFPKYKF